MLPLGTQAKVALLLGDDPSYMERREWSEEIFSTMPVLLPQLRVVNAGECKSPSPGRNADPFPFQGKAPQSVARVSGERLW